MPLSELPMMKALLAKAAARAGGKITSKKAFKEDPKKQVRMLTLTIIDKIQVLALRSPRTLLVVAQVIDKLLDEQLEALDKKGVGRGQRRRVR